MNHNSLENYYKTLFSLVQHHNWSGEYIENLIPFERTIYVELLEEYLKKLEQETKHG